MPELPEVETVKKVLLSLIKNKNIINVDISYVPTIIGDAKSFKNAITGKSIKDITRYGKYLFIHLNDDLVIISHLRMEGKYYLLNEKERDSYYARVTFHFSDGTKLCYDDSRCFGKMKLSDEKHYLKEKEISKLGPEPFTVNDVTFLYEKCRRKTLPIKTTLLDQSLMAGLGNIYVDETLYESKIHPLTPAKLITMKQWGEIVANAKMILQTAIDMGGSTIKSYHPGRGIDGAFQTRIKVYGRKNSICPRCGATYRFMKVNGRGTTFCPCCQIKLGKPLTIAVTGKIASGKSTVLKEFEKRGYASISADDIVHQLYQNENVTRKIEALLGIKFNKNYVDTKILRDHLLTHIYDKRKLENYIHPLVIKEVENFIKTCKTPIKVVEIPLLFESGMENMFDTIIAVDISEEEQNKRLVKRNGEQGLLLKEINKTNKFNEYKNKVEFLVDNSGEEKEFVSSINKIIDKLEDRLI